MIKRLHIRKYRKLVDIDIEFSKEINLLAGTNGTCKTSILYLISNSFKSVPKREYRVKDYKCIEIINSINTNINPKLESLTKGDKKYNDPAPGHKGCLYQTDYFNSTTLEFRRHNSKLLVGNRFSVKPSYKRGEKDSLPSIPIIYLSLSRLVPYGEYQEEQNLIKVAKSLPIIYQNKIAQYYKSFTGVDITYSSAQKMGDIKTRAEFVTDKIGIDSNTISAGEDNLFIILTALVSLQFYFESIDTFNDVESILLIDELDATLHPAFQIKLMDLFKKCATDYKIQFIFTSHSMTLIENALDNKYNVIYFMDDIDSVSIMEDVDIYKIKMSLNAILKKDIYFQKKIPIFTEDNEARSFLKCLLEYGNEIYISNGFSRIYPLLYLANIKISCEALKNIFCDSQLLRATMRSICILDGDAQNNLSNHIMILPGGTNPEEVAFTISDSLYDKKTKEFWQHPDIKEFGYEITYYRDNIKPEIERIYSTIDKLKSDNKSIHGVKRELIKEVYQKYQEFFECVFKYWIRQPENQVEVDKFFMNLRTLFKKVARYNDINPKEWN